MNDVPLGGLIEPLDQAAVDRLSAVAAAGLERFTELSDQSFQLRANAQVALTPVGIRPHSFCCRSSVRHGG